MKSFAFCLMAGVFLAGCATMDKQRLADPSVRKPLDPLVLDIGYDVYLLRADLNRSTHTETRTTTQSGMNGATYTTIKNVTVPDPYHYVAVSLGNGILFDYNHNLCLDLASFYGLGSLSEFTVTQKAIGLFAGSSTFEKKQDSFSEIDHAFLGGTRTATLSKTSVAIVEPGFLGAKPRLTIGADNISYNPAGFLGLGAVTVTKPDPATVILPGFWSQEVFRKVDDNHITLGSALQITKGGDSIEITYNGLFGTNTKYTFFRTATGCVFFNKANFQGIEVRKTDHQILVLQNGTIVATYVIEKP